MTPGNELVLPHMVGRCLHTKRMPENQSQLRYLLALLAQLQESCFASAWLHELCYPLEDASVLFRHADIGSLDVVCRTARNDVIAR